MIWVFKFNVFIWFPVDLHATRRYKNGAVVNYNCCLKIRRQNGQLAMS